MNIVWLRRDLRVDDNSALLEAAKGNNPVVAVYIATPHTWQKHDLAPIQADFIYRRLFELQKDLVALHIPLLYFEVDTFTDSADKMVELAQVLNSEAIFINKEYELNETRRDDYLDQRLSSLGKTLHRFDDKCIFPPGSVMNKQGEYFKVFTPFKKAYLSKLSLAPVHPKKAAQLACKADLGEYEGQVLTADSPFSYPRASSERYPVETKAIYDKLRAFNDETVERYKEERDFPAVDGTSGLSPYLTIGALSVRQCMARVLYQQPLPLSLGRETWQSELIWREFYQHLTYFEPKLSMGKSFLPWGQALVWQEVLASSSCHVQYLPHPLRLDRARPQVTWTRL